MIIPTDMLLQIAHDEHQQRITRAEQRRTLRLARRRPRGRARTNAGGAAKPTKPATVPAPAANLAECGYGAASTTR